MDPKQNPHHLTQNTTRAGMLHDYKDVLIAQMALNYVLDDKINTFCISSNSKDFDIFIETTNNRNVRVNHVLQLEHVQEGTDSFLSKIDRTSGALSIKKYFDHYQKIIKTTAPCSLVLFINCKFDIPDAGKNIKLENENVEVKISKIYKNQTNVFGGPGNRFKFEVASDKDSKEAQGYKQFFKNFFLYTNQANVEGATEDLLNHFCRAFGCGRLGGESYLNFVKQCSKTKGQKQKLTQVFMKEVIALQLLTPYCTPLKFSTSNANKKKKLLKEVVQSFDVTLISEKSCARIQTIWASFKEECEDSKKIKQIAVDYQFLQSSADDVGKLKEEALSKILWLSGTHPLIVGSNDVTRKAIELSGNNFIVLDKNFTTKARTVFERLPDLAQKTSVYDKIIENFTCSYRGRENISLKSLIELNPELAATLTMDELLSMTENPFRIVEFLRFELVSAVCQKDFEMSKLLLERGADVNTKDDHDRTLVYLACLNEDNNIVKLLLEYEANINVPSTKQGVTPLHIVAAKNCNEIVKLFLDNKADVNAVDSDGTTPLHVASLKGHYDIVDLLIKHGAAINAQLHRGFTAIHLACQNGFEQIVKLLLKHNADLNIADAQGWFPIHVAAVMGYSEIIRVLLEHKSEKNCRNEHGFTPIHVASSKGHTDAVRILAHHGADVNIKDNNGRTALYHSCMDGFYHTTGLLLQEKADIRIVNENGINPLHAASGGGFSKIVELLLKYQVDVNAADTWCALTPLHYACMENHYDVAALLVKHGADVNVVDVKGYTPLHRAAENGKFNIAKLLVVHNAETHKKTNIGKTAADLAVAKGHTEIYHQLLS